MFRLALLPLLFAALACNDLPSSRWTLHTETLMGEPVAYAAVSSDATTGLAGSPELLAVCVVGEGTAPEIAFVVHWLEYIGENMQRGRIRFDDGPSADLDLFTFDLPATASRPSPADPVAAARLLLDQPLVSASALPPEALTDAGSHDVVVIEASTDSVTTEDAVRWLYTGDRTARKAARFPLVGVDTVVSQVRNACGGA